MAGGNPVTRQECGDSVESIACRSFLSIWFPTEDTIGSRTRIRIPNHARNAYTTGITIEFASAYHPETVGAVERQHRPYKEALAKFCITHATDWDQLLPILMFSMRTSVHSSTQMTPIFMLTGREARYPQDLDED